MELEFSGEVWWWRGPAPFHFITVPADEAEAIATIAPLVTYGWGMVPVGVGIGGTRWTTALWPKDGGYVVPLKDFVRRDEGIELGDVVSVSLTVDV